MEMETGSRVSWIHQRPEHWLVVLSCHASNLFESIALTGPILRLLRANKDSIQDGKSAALGAVCSAKQVFNLLLSAEFPFAAQTFVG